MMAIQTETPTKPLSKLTTKLATIFMPPKTYPHRLLVSWVADIAGSSLEIGVWRWSQHKSEAWLPEDTVTIAAAHVAKVAKAVCQASLSDARWIAASKPTDSVIIDLLSEREGAVTVSWELHAGSSSLCISRHTDDVIDARYDAITLDRKHWDALADGLLLAIDKTDNAEPTTWRDHYLSWRRRRRSMQQAAFSEACSRQPFLKHAAGSL